MLVITMNLKTGGSPDDTITVNMLDTDLETLLKEFLGDMGDEDSNYPDDDYDIESTKPMFGKIKANSSDVQSNLETSDVKDKFTQYFDKKMEYLTNTEDSQNTSNVIDNLTNIISILPMTK